MQEEIAKRAKQQKCKAHVGKACADPVAPSGVESNIIAKTGGGVCIDTAGQVGTSLRQTVEHHHQRKDANKANSPRDDNRAGIGSARRHIAGKREDTAANARSDDHHGQTKEIQTIGVDYLVVASFRGHICAPPQSSDRMKMARTSRIGCRAIGQAIIKLVKRPH